MRSDWNFHQYAEHLEDNASHRSGPLYQLQVRQDHLVSQRTDLSSCFLINQ